MKNILVTTILVMLSGLAVAYPLTSEQHKTFVSNVQLKTQMDKMIMSFADMDIMMNREGAFDYDVLKEDATTILKSVKEIRIIDKEGILNTHLENLEAPTKKMLEYSEKRDKRAKQYPQEIFNACFKCHTDHRSW